MPSWSAAQRGQRFESWAESRHLPDTDDAGASGAAEGQEARGEELLARCQVYVLCIPQRRRHAEDLMSRWAFKCVTFVDGINKDSLDIGQCVKDGLVAEEYEEVIWEDHEYVPEGKVACHMGHIRILRAFLQQDERSFAMIFEDDLEDESGLEVMRELVAFLSKVPSDFDLLHLGFVRESRAARRPVDAEGTVYRSAEALGRHAYVVTKRTAQLLLEATVPMYNHGDKMFQDVYRKHALVAYQPREPLFYQDRVRFESELTHLWKPSRAFQPTPEDDGVRARDRLEWERRQELRARKAQETAEQLEAQLLQLPEEEQAVYRQLQAEGHDLSALLAPRPSAVLFLGVEGVLNTEKTQAATQSGRPDLDLLRNLAKVVEATGCSLVPTSSRCLENRWLVRFLGALVRAGVPRSSVVGCAAPERPRTDAELREARAREIANWLQHSGDVERWAVVDCLDLGGACGRALAGRCVRTDPRRGLRPMQVQDLVGKLGLRAQAE